MTPPNAQPEAARARPAGGLLRAAGIAATAAAGVFAVALATRPLADTDLGYHLAYGEHFLKTGQIVQTNQFIYTKLRQEPISEPGEIGPGCRYDAETGTYHFVNANWLSQVIFAAVHRAGGLRALSVLQAVLVAAIFAVVIVTMRRCGVAWHWAAPAVLLAAMTAYERFNLRPELPGYLVLVSQWCLLAGRRFGRRSAVAVAALQVLAVNLHSYFLLGIALSGAMFAEALARWLWARTVTRRPDAEGRQRMKWLAVATGGAVLACLCNPWHVRGAVMPVEAMIFVSRHNISGWTALPASKHPWATIGEFTTPLANALRHLRVTRAYVLLLAVAAVAGVVAVARRRSGWLLALAGMTAVSHQMRRNLAAGALVMAPLSAIILADGWEHLRNFLARRRSSPAGKPRGRLRARLPGAAAGVVAAASIALSAWWTASLTTNRFYSSQRLGWRFGLGGSEFMLPLSATRWLNQHRPPGRVFCDFAASANLLFFTRPHWQVPILTNTWAYPPYVMHWVYECVRGRQPLEPIVREYGISTVVLSFSPANAPLLGALAGSADWAAAHLGPGHVVFLRRRRPGAELAAKCGIARADFDVDEFIERVVAADPVGAFSLHRAATAMMWMDWPEHAERVWGACIELDSAYPEALSSLGALWMQRGHAQMPRLLGLLRAGEIAQAERLRGEVLAHWRQAEALLRRCLEVRPDHPPARHNLPLLGRQIEDLRRLFPAPAPGELDAATRPGYHDPAVRP